MHKSFLAVAGLLLVVAGCQSGSSPAGTYRLEGANAALGEGADMLTLVLKTDNTYTLDLPPLAVAKGTWKSEEGKISLTDGGSFGNNYRIDGGKLIPIGDDGVDKAVWHFKKQ